ncbi:hypothetical protein SAMN05216196_103139 [Lutimaribacter pacificus]|uniref:Uncharacterized protein n=1 Tax=Lutimaribacter pacificus TaxID=391948 RepID=A0A1H0G8P6_9RHOB|nr:hypothetical protein [Lutimaribacter pacificus]SDO03267.1 hypothetical protein SAMN05216196_103139 [Lutimaribacter pacificus]SHJ86070.1 hypothetical protein SAMN05444142_102140 [Lutimaribacter pacificus]
MTPLRPLALIVAAAMALPGPATAQGNPVLSFHAAGQQLRLHPGDIADMQLSENGTAADIHLRVTPDAAADLAALTGQAIGQPMQVRACGHLLLTPIVRERIDSGVLYFQENDAARAKALYTLWQGRTTCADLDTEMFQNGH